MAASIGLQSKELGRDGSLPVQDHHRSTTLRSESAQSAQRGKDRLQCAQSNDKFGCASLRSEEVTGGSKMTARIAVHSRTNALRRHRTPRPLRHRFFRGSIPHPTRLLCTLRRSCRLPRRNTRYRAGATPYPGRTFTGWITPASWRTHDQPTPPLLASVRALCAAL
jgi:hypothetical protein